jgi:hypothetical protein
MLQYVYMLIDWHAHLLVGGKGYVLDILRVVHEYGKTFEIFVWRICIPYPDALVSSTSS